MDLEAQRAPESSPSDLPEITVLDPDEQSALALSFSVSNTIEDCQQLTELHQVISAGYRLLGFVLWTCLTVASILMGSERIMDAIFGYNSGNEARWLQILCAVIELSCGLAQAVSSRYNPDQRKTEHANLSGLYYQLYQDLSKERSIEKQSQPSLGLSEARKARLLDYDSRFRVLLKKSFDSTNYVLFLTQTERRLIQSRERIKTRIKPSLLNRLSRRLGSNSVPTGI